MAVKFRRPWLLLVIIFISLTPFPTYSQSDSPQNIETFFPTQTFTSQPPIIPPATAPKSSNRGTITKAVLITAASTIVAAAMFFLLLQKCVFARRRRERVADQSTAVDGGVRPVLPREDFSRFSGNIKALIVDEDGLDVLYWRKLQSQREGAGDRLNEEYRKQVLRGERDDEEEEKKVIYHKSKKSSEVVQEIPLLRGRSSTSHSKIHNEIAENDLNNTNRHSSVRKCEENSAPIPNPTPPPPPPPPPTAKKGLAPPPPPSSAVKAAAALSASSSKPPPVPKGSSRGESSGGANGQVKLKPLHWDKVNPDSDHSMVWDKIDRGSFSFDGDLMEALFGYVATNKKSPKENQTANPRPSLPVQTFILEPRKSQNTSIVLKSLAMSREDLIDELIEGHDIDADILEKLARIAPTQEELALILEFNGDPKTLADAEVFLFHLLKAVPSAFTRLNALLFKASYYPEISHHKECLKTLDLACKELRARGLFVKLLEAILKAGNRMNAGTARGNAQAFNLTALRKLSDVKSMDGKTTLLHFVVEEVVRSEGKRCVISRNQSFNRTNSGRLGSDSQTGSKEEKEKEYIQLGLPIVGGLSSEFADVKKAALIDYDTFLATCTALTARTKDAKRVLDRCGGEMRGGYAEKMKAFLKLAEEELNAVREEETKVMEFVRRTTEYYQAGALNDKNPFQLFVIIKDFLGMVDKVCIQIAKNLQRKKSPSSGSSSKRNTVKFPILPTNFMCDKSRSNSSGSDTDS